MKKKIISALICFSMSVCLMMGCGTEEAADTAGKLTVEAIPETDVTAEADGNEASQNAAEQSADEQAGTDADDNNSSTDLYEEFLAGNAKLDISAVDFTSDAFGDHTPELNSDETYTIDDFFTAFFTDRAAYNEQDYYVDEIDYAYIDCPEDGSRNLALRFTSYMYSDEYNNIMVIRNIDGQLKLCIWVSDGYRSYNYINTNGVIAEGGSGGASDWIDNYFGIDSNGDKYVIYESETCSAYDIYLNGEDYGQKAEELGAGDIYITRYAFEEYPYDEYDEETYYAYMNECYYTYGILSETGETDYSDEIYDPESSYAKFMSTFTDNWHSHDEMETILNDKLAERSLTTDMLSENDPEWVKLEGHDSVFAGLVKPDTAG